MGNEARQQPLCNNKKPPDAPPDCAALDVAAGGAFYMLSSSTMATHQKQLDTLVERLKRLSNSVARLQESVDAFHGFYRSESTPALYQLPVDVDYFYLKIVRDALADSIVLQIACLLDAAKGTLSLDKFLDRMAKTQAHGQRRWSKQEIQHLRNRVAALQPRADSLVQVRHKLIAHKDDALATGQDTVAKATFDQAAEVAGELIALVADLHEAIHGTKATGWPPSGEGAEAIDFLAECIELRRLDRRQATIKVLSTR